MNCEIHDKKPDLYCKKHDIAICMFCIPSEHKTCSSSDVISIDEASKNAKQSSALSDLEETISKTLDDVQYCINDRETALKNVDKEEQTIRRTIAKTRLSLTKYIDELERKLLLDLKSQHENCKSKYIKILDQMKQIEKELENLREQTLKMKRFASDLQVFLGTRQLNKTITEKIGSLKEDIRDHTNNRMELGIHHVISSLMKEVMQFGEMKVIETKDSLQLKDAKIDQAQIQIHGSLENVRNIRLQPKQKFDIEGLKDTINGCIISPDDSNIFVVYYETSKVMEYNNIGQHIRDIPVSNKLFDLTAIDTDRIAVTYGESKYLEIVNTKNKDIRKKLKCSSSCFGISYQDQKLKDRDAEKSKVTPENQETSIETVLMKTRGRGMGRGGRGRGRKVSPSPDDEVTNTSDTNEQTQNINSYYVFIFSHVCIVKTNTNGTNHVSIHA
ncbi:unnamed protein product [Mytilus coruscus]|uniref:B box-type domain-containing protein n=1 Tax=Mytilus coruscus TaxID=42192 RepID=A0A6J8AEK3_MYTCO|nr:unnamed protein product [Mytilus coruscus]